MIVESKKTGTQLDITPEQWETLKEIEGRNWKVIKGATVQEMTRSKVKPDVAIPLNVQKIIDAGKVAPLIDAEQQTAETNQIKNKKKNRKSE